MSRLEPFPFRFRQNGNGCCIVYPYWDNPEGCMHPASPWSLSIMELFWTISLDWVCDAFCYDGWDPSLRAYSRTWCGVITIKSYNLWHIQEFYLISPTLFNLWMITFGSFSDMLVTGTSNSSPLILVGSQGQQQKFRDPVHWVLGGSSTDKHRGSVNGKHLVHDRCWQESSLS